MGIYYDCYYYNSILYSRVQQPSGTTGQTFFQLKKSLGGGRRPDLKQVTALDLRGVFYSASDILGNCSGSKFNHQLLHHCKMEMGYAFGLM